ncbi:hypothetical protein B0H14DRAFT_3464082 [Mycena olivaceomarginata]|nr:hypothetical protein B0H14DRAFT_3464082 [Mycena olivaceomarginata]
MATGHDGDYTSRISFPLGQFGLCIGYSRASRMEIRSDETCGDLLAAVPYYRTYSSTLISHSYTTDVPALNGGIIQSGYPLQTFYCLSCAGHIFHTASTTERDNEIAAGYALYMAEPPVYIYPTQICGSVPFYRLFNAAAQDTFYTISESERLDFITNQGYTDVEIAAYLLLLGNTECT